MVPLPGKAGEVQDIRACSRAFAVPNQSFSFKSPQLIPALENRAMIFRMENARTDFDQRLRAHGERLLKALDAQAMPETYADILRAARALVAVKKAFDLLYREEASIETKARPAARAKETPAAQTPALEPAATADDDPPVMNRQMRRMAKALARKAFRGDEPLRASG